MIVQNISTNDPGKTDVSFAPTMTPGRSAALSDQDAVRSARRHESAPISMISGVCIAEQTCSTTPAAAETRQVKQRNSGVRERRVCRVIRAA